MRCLNSSGNEAIIKDFYWTRAFNLKKQKYRKSLGTFTVSFLCRKCSYKSALIVDFEDPGPWNVKCHKCNKSLYIPPANKLSRKK